MGPSSSGTWTAPVLPRYVPLGCSYRVSVTPNAVLKAPTVPESTTLRRARLASTTSRPCSCAKASTLAMSSADAPCAVSKLFARQVRPLPDGAGAHRLPRGSRVRAGSAPHNHGYLDALRWIRRTRRAGALQR